MALQKPSYIKPSVGSDIDKWGDILNETIDTTDAFNSKIVEDSSNQDQEIARLDREKINQSDIDTVVQVTVDNYMDTTAKPNLNNHIETVNKPELERYTNIKKTEINTFTEEQKVELDNHEKVKEGEITSFVESKKTELVNYVDTVSKVEINSHTEKKKVEIDVFTDEQKLELDSHEKVKETELDLYEKVKESQLDSYVETVSKIDLDKHLEDKKLEIDTFTEEQKVELDTHEKLKEYELDEYNLTVKKPELDSYATVKETQITTHTNQEISRATQEIEDKSFIEQGLIREKGQEELDKIAGTGLESVTERVETLESDKQDKIDQSLLTVDKTIVGAINELNPLAKEVPNKAEKSIKVIAGKGLVGGGDLTSDKILDIVSEDEGILVKEDNIKLNVVDDLITGGVKRALSAEQGKVLKQLIDAIGAGGVTRLLRQAEVLSDYEYIGNLPSGGKTIAVGKQLFEPTLYLNGIRIESNKYSVDLNLGSITLTEIYSSEYDVIWVVEDEMPHHISFCFPTMNLLTGSAEIKGRIVLGDVIKILGNSDADDGGHYLVKCESTAKLNAVDIGGGRFLNEIPNTKISTLVNSINSLSSSKLDKTAKAVDSDKLDGQDSTYFAKQTDMANANTQINQNKSDILLKRDITDKNFGASITFSSVGNDINLMKGDIDSNKYNLIKRRMDNNTYFNIFDSENCPISKAQNGWCKLANGLIIQWGSIKSDSGLEKAQPIVFPLSFTTTNYTFSLSKWYNIQKANKSGWVVAQQRESSINLYTEWEGATETVKWIAIGY